MSEANAIATELRSRHSRELPKKTLPLPPREVKRLLTGIPGWQARRGQISRTFPFKNFHETMAFVNAVAWIAHGENHHPDLEVGYNQCIIHYSTHSVGGLSENDFISAAKVNALMDGE